jgi:hypothetical protein
MTDTPYINVAVPAHRLTEVYRLLGESDSSEGQDEEEPNWSVEDLGWVADSNIDSLVRVGAMLDDLSATPGKSKSLTDLAKSTGYTRGELKGGLSGFARWTRAEWGDGEHALFDVRSGPSKTNGMSNEAYYAVSDALAENWKAARTP